MICNIQTIKINFDIKKEKKPKESIVLTINTLSWYKKTSLSF